MNKSKRKLIIDNTSLKTVIISSLNIFNQKTQLGSVLLKKQLTSNTKDINISIINANTYYATCYLKKAQVFAISLKSLQY